jgi:hypothetical protein
MAVIRRPSTNYIPGAGISIVKADNPGLDAVDVTITNTVTVPKRMLLAEWVGPLPTTTGPGLEFTVPTARGVTITFPLTKLYSRLNVLPAGTTSFRWERSTGGSAFTAITVGTTSHTTSDYEKTNSSPTGSVVSGDVVRLYFTAVNGRGGLFYASLQGDET